MQPTESGRAPTTGLRSRPWVVAALVGTIAAGAELGWWWTRAAAPAAIATAPSHAAHRSAGVPGSDAADLLPEPDLERRQAGGRAQPGPSPADGEALTVAGREVGRLHRSRAASAPTLVIVAAPAEAEVLARGARATRDYHLVVAMAASSDVEGSEASTALGGVFEAARDALGAGSSGVAIVAIGASASAAIALAATRPDVQALALVAPDVAWPALPDGALEAIAARPTMIVHGREDSRALTVVARMRGNPLLHPVVFDGAWRGSELWQRHPRVLSDLWGWLFAVTPPQR